MTAALPRNVIAEAYIAACRLEVRTLKPGNVHIFADGHRMTVADFDHSANASAPFIADPALSVGDRILNAVEATFAAVATNTNLGIVLLCAPLAAAAEHCTKNASFADSLHAVLAALDHNDACAVYKAIAMANPAGLGSDKAGDVRAEPPADWTLLDAMRAAAPRDMIAQEYATGFATDPRQRPHLDRRHRIGRRARRRACHALPAPPFRTPRYPHHPQARARTGPPRHGPRRGNIRNTRSPIRIRNCKTGKPLTPSGT